MDSKSGTISIRAPGEHEFDREIISTHYLTIEARDSLGQGNRNTVQLILTILDMNDNAPMFLERQYEAKLLENQLAFEIPLVVKAKDADLKGTRNSEVTYHIVDGEYRENFTINNRTGAVTLLRPMDFEAIKHRDKRANIQPLQLTVIAKDQGSPSLSSRAMIIVYLIDVNDHAPQFEKEFYTASIPENFSGGSNILQVKAVDNDGSPPNNLIVYRIQQGASDKFVISSDNGKISVAEGTTLDPDLTAPKTMEYSLTVVSIEIWKT